eukprot:366366-Chlamydomonas_euryale.AAC.30
MLGVTITCASSALYWFSLFNSISRALRQSYFSDCLLACTSRMMCSDGTHGTDAYAHPSLAAAVALSAREPDESQPYDHKYASAQLLADAISAASVADGIDAADCDEQVAVLRARRGLVLLETDLLPDGQADVEAALAVLQQRPSRHLGLLIECHNALGALQSSRDDLDGARARLVQAKQLYAAHRRSAEGSLGGVAGSHADAASTPSVWDDVERQHTSTLFFLAQVHGHAGERQQSAECCAATLQRQLDSGEMHKVNVVCGRGFTSVSAWLYLSAALSEFQLQEWVQNLLQLSGYYVAQHGFVIAHYCLEAVDHVRLLGVELTWGRIQT